MVRSFFQPLHKYVNYLKLRASYGLIGSDETGLAAGAPHFLYKDNVQLSHDQMGYTTGENLNYTLKGPIVHDYAVQGASWERVKKFNIGLDAQLFNTTHITAEYFFDERYAILLKREAWPQSLGYHLQSLGQIRDAWITGVQEFSFNYNPAPKWCPY